jgi:hypothetical protein
MQCSICRRDVDAVGDWTEGHNAQPVNDGRCCSFCNSHVVIPARIEMWVRSHKSLETKTDGGAPSPKPAGC